MAALAVAAPPRGRVPALLPPALTTATTGTPLRFIEARTQFERRSLEWRWRAREGTGARRPLSWACRGKDC
jgi:hypothetical protein